MVQQHTQDLGLELTPLDAGPAVTDTKSRPKNTPSTSPVEKMAWASGEASASSGVAKSRVPLAITVSPGRNFRVRGLGVVSVWISMGSMWAGTREGSSSTDPGRSIPGDHHRFAHGSGRALAIRPQAGSRFLERATSISTRMQRMPTAIR
jgi:hypothetical protein